MTDHPYVRDHGAPARPACVICGDGRDTRFGLVRYLGSTTAEYAYGPRCVDRDACRTRTKTNGDEYPEDYHR
jgi:hypothetical protein